MKIMDITKIQNQLQKFAVDRDWEQFHTPKNLAMALSVEASELVEIFQWLNAEESNSPDQKKTEEILVLSDDYINLQPSSGKPYECYKVEI